MIYHVEATYQHGKPMFAKPHPVRGKQRAIQFATVGIDAPGKAATVRRKDDSTLVYSCWYDQYGFQSIHY